MHRFKRLQSVLRVGLFVAAAIVLTHCGKTTTTPASGTFGSVYSIIQGANCTQCHAPNGGSAKTGDSTAIDFTSQTTAYNTLTGNAKVVGSNASTCNNVLLVDTTAAQSYLAYAFLQASDPTHYGTPSYTKQPGCVPATVAGHNVNISADEEASIVAWINAGAPNN